MRYKDSLRPSGEGIDILDGNVREGIDKLYGKIREAGHKLPLAALLWEAGYLLYLEIRKAGRSLYLDISAIFDHLDLAVQPDALIGALAADLRGSIGRQDSYGQGKDKRTQSRLYC